MSKPLVSSAERKSVYSGVYFHGQLENTVGIDLVCLESGTLVAGRQKVTVKVLIDGRDEGIDAEAYLFYDSRRIHLRGLIVNPASSVDVEYAISVMNDTPEVI